MKIQSFANRRSIRSYKDKQIDEQTLNNIVDAALTTPTAINMQAYKIVVVERNALSKEDFEKLVSSQPHALQASHIAIVFTLRDDLSVETMLEELTTISPAMRDKFKDWVRRDGQTNFGIKGQAYALTLAMALEADANGIGSTIFAGVNKQLASQHFKDTIDTSRYEATLSISLGYKADDFVIPEKKMKSKEELVKFVKAK